MNDIDFSDVDFARSSFCEEEGDQCVVVARRQGEVGVRDSKDPTKRMLRFTTQEWRNFVAGVKAGEFDA